ncbi:putative ADP-ribosylation factor GTPase-activating protein AGD11 [Platanthera zijinensis]|uniref:ADP-ribosylation factor GTPase-activating protein AGD11 n=1 Tax=Platanthera zijinensis TaxID=2320716 RepID=A0AAP0GD34_9ASPA
MFLIPDPIPPLRLQVYDKDTFNTDDRMGEAEIDIQLLILAAKAYKNSSILEPMQLGKWLATEDNALAKDSIIALVDGRVKQDISLKLQNVESGQLEVELECMSLSQ